MSYPCQKLSARWVVYKVNHWERLHTSGDVGYHENQVDAGEVGTEEATRGGRVNGRLIKFFHKKSTYVPCSKPQTKTLEGK
jgi:hypothetical protein